MPARPANPGRPARTASPGACRRRVAGSAARRRAVTTPARCALLRLVALALRGALGADHHHRFASVDDQLVLEIALADDDRARAAHLDRGAADHAGVAQPAR